MFSKTSYHIEISQLICKANWYVMSKIAKQSMSGYYVWRMLSFNHGWHSFYCPKIISRKIDKEAIKLFKLHLLLYVKNWATFHHFFHLSFRKVLYENVLSFIIKVPYEDILLSIITCRHLSLTYHTQKYFIKAFYCLAKTWFFVN